MKLFLQVLGVFVVLAVLIVVGGFFYLKKYSNDERAILNELVTIAQSGISTRELIAAATERGYPPIQVGQKHDPNMEDVAQAVASGAETRLVFQKTVFPPFGRWFVDTTIQGEKVLSAQAGSLD